MNQTLDGPTLRSLYLPLRLTYGLVPLLAGLDKFFGFLADWPHYLAPALAGLLPFSTATFFAIVGVVEMAVGVLVLTRWPRLGAFLAMGWLVLIAFDLVLAGFYDIAVRDLAMAVGAYTLARLAELAAEAPAPSGARLRAVTA
ncbi:MAG TPA: hypothetical protein VGV61_03525 [Thermoanaerobaculia bacterium]|nr:hypothetical protein [Thermoanaerobaculia bacterium]